MSTDRFDDLLNALDRVHGGEGVSESRYQVTKRGFSADHGEHFVDIRYSYRRSTDPRNNKLSRKKTPSKKQKIPKVKQPSQKNLKQVNLALMKQLNALAKSKGATIPLTQRW